MDSTDNVDKTTTPVVNKLPKVAPQMLHLIYDTVADMMPLEGRDFTIKYISIGDSSATSLSIEANSEIGKAWVPFLHKAIKHKMEKKQGEYNERHRTEK